MTQHEQEAYVRSKWIDVYDCGGFVCLYGGPGRQAVLFAASRPTSVEAWQAVYDFTVGHEEEIRQLEREAFVLETKASILLGLVCSPWVEVFDIRTLCAMCRTLARLDQKLTELKREMKETA